MARLALNLEGVASLREQSTGNEPDPVTAAILAETGGVDGIVCPLHEEQPMLTKRDARVLKETVKSHLNLQIPATDDMLSFTLGLMPDMVTFIPNSPKEIVAEHKGLDLLSHTTQLNEPIMEMRKENIVTSVLIQPDVHQVKAASKLGVDYIELHLGQLLSLEDDNEKSDFLVNVSQIVTVANKLDLGVSVSYGVDYYNVEEIAKIENIEEINIGYSMITKALWIGIENAVRDFMALVH